eukprot:jgi/Chlat1/3682/Chrsp24S00802
MATSPQAAGGKPMTTVKEALKAWEEKNGQKCTDAEKIQLCGQFPPIEKMDGATLSTCKNCQHLSLSTNAIEKIAALSNMPKQLRVLSLGRNLLKRLENLDGLADSLEELWASYNNIEKLAGVEKLTKLRVLYLSNNKIDSWAEVERLKGLSNLEDLLFVNNPLYLKTGSDQLNPGSAWRVELIIQAQVLKRLPQLKKLDGVPIDGDEREAAKAGAPEAPG